MSRKEVIKPILKMPNLKSIMSSKIEKLRSLITRIIPTREAAVFYIKYVVYFLLILWLIPAFMNLIGNKLHHPVHYQLTYSQGVLFVLSVAVLFLIRAKEKIDALKESRQQWLQTFIFLYFSLLFYSFYFYIKHYSDIFSVYLYLARYLLLAYLLNFLAALFLALAIFNISFFRKFKVELATAFSASILFFIFALSLRVNWHFFSASLIKAAYFFLHFKFPDATYSLGGDPVLYINNFSAAVGAPCSGIEGLSLFAGLFLLMVFLDYKIVDFKKVPLFFVGGLIGMYLMSVIRITTLFYIGTINPEFALTAFHTNIGWILFFVYFLFFLYVVYPFMRKPIE